ncbi:hypothetical protein [Brucella lupini]|uniref:Uncharacterized protein n=1 Tax=Brucella lupini TaxID=255457 RepID=A0A256H1X5_9HYPH|nr:hypothetical protein [Brucella lupini]KAB2699902.1 hypothetical protein F9L03_24840 [Brucella lupini]OYR32971.1 hypothetical protein CES86_5279 [Brucella lupini]
MNEKINTLNVFNYRNLPLIVFVILTFGGCSFIAVSKVSGMNPIFSMFVPILLMFGYLVLAWSFSAIRLHDEQTGDNLYYMGFLFTLASLGASLYLFTGDSSTDDVVRNFGIAISSTITGIALRIFYNQTRRDVLDIERATRHDLAAAARRVRTELETSSRDFASLRRANNQLINEGFEGVVEQVERTGEKLESALLKLTEATIKPLEATAEKYNRMMEENLSDVSGKLADITKTIEASLSGVSKANQTVTSAASELSQRVTEVSKKLQSVTVPKSVLKNEMGPLLQEIGQLIKDQAERQDALAKEQSERIEKLLGAIGSINDVVKKKVEHSERLLKANEALNGRIEEKHGNLDLNGSELSEPTVMAAPIFVQQVSLNEAATSAVPSVTSDDVSSDAPAKLAGSEGKTWWPFK